MRVSDTIRTIPSGEELSGSFVSLFLIFVMMVFGGEHYKVVDLVVGVRRPGGIGMMGLGDFCKEEIILHFSNIIGQGFNCFGGGLGGIK